MMLPHCKVNPHIAAYMESVEAGVIRACEEQHLLVAHIRRCFESEDIHTDDEQLEHYLSLARYFPFEVVFPWQAFFIGLHLCTYRADGMPRWPDAMALIGRGAGKDGTIAWEGMCLMTPYNGVKGYDVDICANNEEQAMRPVFDVIEALDTPTQTRKLKKHFYWTKEQVVGLQTRSTMKGRTNSPKGKDGLRSGICIFNEIHQYENYANINVFKTGLGKKKHPRRTYYTTNGDVRDGPLDDLLQSAHEILHDGEPDNGFLPFICKLNSKADVDDPENWQMANPSLPYRPDLLEEIKKEYAEWKRNPHQLPAFMTKRMNIPQSDKEIAVTDWENVEATNRPLPDMDGWACTCGIDYAKINDWAAVNLHFRRGDERFEISHSWFCLNSADLSRIKAPWRDWADDGLITIVDDVEISPDLLAEYIREQMQKFYIVKMAMDNNRFDLVKRAMRKIGFAPEYKNLQLVRPNDIYKVQPVIESCFNNQYFAWGDCPPLRWATNNTKLKRRGRDEGTDTGNFYYAKIEAKSRKTDPFMALVASMVIEDALGDGMSYSDLPGLSVITG
nr:MAG: terminase large subunit [Caudoviricetes sp.]